MNIRQHNRLQCTRLVFNVTNAFASWVLRTMRLLKVTDRKNEHEQPGLRILYVTAWVLGDAGANAAELFPRLASKHPMIDQVYVADFEKNKKYITDQQRAIFVRLKQGKTWVRYAARIASLARQKDVDIIHVFYRQQNAILLILIRVFLSLLRARTKLIMDHRSVNLAKGWTSLRKRLLNQVMQAFSHHLAGNPWAPETNHFKIFRPISIIDLGYDTAPNTSRKTVRKASDPVQVWYIGSLKPRNRKSQFLIDVMQEVGKRDPQCLRQIQFQVAGPANQSQKKALDALSNVTFHGKLERADLYQRLDANPGIGLAFMNHEFHAYAPSLKFAEYAIMRCKILASDTFGLKTQAERMNISDIRFVRETVHDWADAIIESAQTYSGPQPMWADAKKWSYPHIFCDQVISLYQDCAKHTRRNRQASAIQK